MIESWVVQYLYDVTETAPANPGDDGEILLEANLYDGEILLEAYLYDVTETAPTNPGDDGEILFEAGLSGPPLSPSHQSSALGGCNSSNVGTNIR
jgi:hypothetical protein